MDKKLAWQGLIISVQPRIRLTRSFDQRSHTYLGFAIRIDGEIDGIQREFLIGIGKAAQEKHQFRNGDVCSGMSVSVSNPKTEVVEFYKTSRLKVVSRSEQQLADCKAPWQGVTPPLPIYRERGHRRLHKKIYQTKCLPCIWGCHMPVELIIDPWKPHIAPRYRTETFCYGPKSCTLYQAGPKRTAPGRNGMRFEEEDWIDEDATAHREPDD